MIAIIDYDAGNLKSVQKACLHLGADIIITKKPKEILEADKIILPGVGNFGDAMINLQKYQLVDVIHEAVERNKYFLGICVGLQLLFESSEEDSSVKGLGILKGQIKKFPAIEGLKIPHMGWNTIKINPNSKLLKDIENASYVYFVHSYYLEAANKQDVAATTEYGVTVDAAVEHNNIFASQFHLEKSGETGLKILNNFINIDLH